jgi:hypothetical protein
MQIGNRRRAARRRVKRSGPLPPAGADSHERSVLDAPPFFDPG